MSVVSTGLAPTTRSRYAPRPGSLYYEKELRAASVTHKHYIAGVAVVTLSGSTWATQYLHRDHLGSVTAITDHTGTVIERFAYDPWGKRRFPAGPADPNGTIRGDPTLAFATDRGFTNHEHLDGLGLIHMNGRIFDPTLARFASADPHIQHAGNMQSYNRYSYVLNNPLIYTDPTGFFLKKLFKGVKKLVQKILKNLIVRAVAAVAVGVMTGIWVNNLLTSAAMGTAAASSMSTFVGIKALAGMAGGFAGTLVGTGGDLNAALTGAAVGGAFGFVGGMWAAGSPPSYIGHAVVGCASSKAQGGNCARGAAAQLASKWATIKTDGMKWSTEQQFVAATVVGGSVSVIGGRKFANGALTAAAGYLFNQVLRKAEAQRRAEARNLAVMRGCVAGFENHCAAVGGHKPYGEDDVAALHSEIRLGSGLIADRASSGLAAAAPWAGPAAPKVAGAALGLKAYAYWANPPTAQQVAYDAAATVLGPAASYGRSPLVETSIIFTLEAAKPMIAR